MNKWCPGFTVRAREVCGWATLFSCHGGRLGSSPDPPAPSAVSAWGLFVHLASSAWWPTLARNETLISPILSPTLPANDVIWAIIISWLVWEHMAVWFVKQSVRRLIPAVQATDVVNHSSPGILLWTWTPPLHVDGRTCGTGRLLLCGASSRAAPGCLCPEKRKRKRYWILEIRRIIAHFLFLDGGTASRWKNHERW